MRNKRQFIFSSTVLAALIMASGCSMDRLGQMAPFSNMGTSPPIGGTMLVRNGDTVDALAARYRVSSRDIISANNLTAPYRLTQGQRLVLPKPSEYVVRPHDTLYNVARLFNVAPVDLAQYNDLKQPYSLNVGQVLRIPGGQDSFTTFTIEEAPSLPAQKMEPVEVENLKSSEKNPVSSPHKLAISQPAPISKEMQDLPVAEALSAMIKSVAAGEVLDVKPIASTAPKKETLSAVAMKKAEASPLLQQAAWQTTIIPAAKSGYVWPVKGKIISSYGPKTGKLFNDGVNIAAPRGTPVQAASDGVVAYTGSDLGSYGNLILIRHNSGVMTAYAHLQNIIVKKGDKVKMGNVIGAVGSSGMVNDSQLHFEIRQGRKSIDPGPYLGVSS